MNFGYLLLILTVAIIIVVFIVNKNDDSDNAVVKNSNNQPAFTEEERKTYLEEIIENYNIPSIVTAEESLIRTNNILIDTYESLTNVLFRIEVFEKEIKQYTLQNGIDLGINNLDYENDLLCMIYTDITTSLFALNSLQYTLQNKLESSNEEVPFDASETFYQIYTAYSELQEIFEELYIKITTNNKNIKNYNQLVSIQIKNQYSLAERINSSFKQIVCDNFINIYKTLSNFNSSGFKIGLKPKQLNIKHYHIERTQISQATTSINLPKEVLDNMYTPKLDEIPSYNPWYINIVDDYGEVTPLILQHEELINHSLKMIKLFYPVIFVNFTRVATIITNIRDDIAEDPTKRQTYNSISKYEKEMLHTLFDYFEIFNILLSDTSELLERFNIVMYFPTGEPTLKDKLVKEFLMLYEILKEDCAATGTITIMIRENNKKARLGDANYDNWLEKMTYKVVEVNNILEDLKLQIV